MKKAYIYINYKNIVVLQTYLDVIKSALENNGFQCEYIKDYSGIEKESLIIFPMGNDAFKAYLSGYRNQALWQQGVTAEESFLRHNSVIRRKVLNFMDSFVMKRARFILFVSNRQKEYYEKLTHKSLGHKCYIMPCFNEQLDEKIIRHKDYSKPFFTYVGSLAKWQCFDQTIAIFKKIQDIIPSASIKILTFDCDSALDVLKNYNVNNYIVKTVPKEQVKNELAECNYGFVIRDNIIVNNVATPTKLSSYMAAGVIPVFSDSLVDFYERTKEMNFVIPVHEGHIDTKLFEQNIDNQLVADEYTHLFSTYYSFEYHVQNLTKTLEVLEKS